jgi:hypothetical protein
MSYRVSTHHINDATQLQLSQNNSFSTTVQFHYNCTHDAMLMLLIVIHLLKFSM